MDVALVSQIPGAFIRSVSTRDVETSAEPDPDQVPRPPALPPAPAPSRVNQANISPTASEATEAGKSFSLPTFEYDSDKDSAHEEDSPTDSVPRSKPFRRRMADAQKQIDTLTSLLHAPRITKRRSTNTLLNMQPHPKAALAAALRNRFVPLPDVYTNDPPSPTTASPSLDNAPNESLEKLLERSLTLSSSADVVPHGKRLNALGWERLRYLSEDHTEDFIRLLNAGYAAKEAELARSISLARLYAQKERQSRLSLVPKSQEEIRREVEAELEARQASWREEEERMISVARARLRKEEEDRRIQEAEKRRKHEEERKMMELNKRRREKEMRESEKVESDRRRKDEEVRDRELKGLEAEVRRIEREKKAEEVKRIEANRKAEELRRTESEKKANEEAEREIKKKKSVTFAQADTYALPEEEEEDGPEDGEEDDDREGEEEGEYEDEGEYDEEAEGYENEDEYYEDEEYESEQDLETSEKMSAFQSVFPTVADSSQTPRQTSAFSTISAFAKPAATSSSIPPGFSFVDKSDSGNAPIQKPVSAFSSQAATATSAFAKPAGAAFQAPTPTTSAFSNQSAFSVAQGPSTPSAFTSQTSAFSKPGGSTATASAFHIPQPKPAASTFSTTTIQTHPSAFAPPSSAFSKPATIQIPPPTAVLKPVEQPKQLPPVSIPAATVSSHTRDPNWTIPQAATNPKPLSEPSFWKSFADRASRKSRAKDSDGFHDAWTRDEILGRARKEVNADKTQKIPLDDNKKELRKGLNQILQDPAKALERVNQMRIVFTKILTRTAATCSILPYDYRPWVEDSLLLSLHHTPQDPHRESYAIHAPILVALYDLTQFIFDKAENEVAGDLALARATAACLAGILAGNQPWAEQPMSGMAINYMTWFYPICFAKPGPIDEKIDGQAFEDFGYMVGEDGRPDESEEEYARKQEGVAAVFAQMCIQKYSTVWRETAYGKIPPRTAPFTASMLWNAIAAIINLPVQQRLPAHYHVLSIYIKFGIWRLRALYKDQCYKLLRVLIGFCKAVEGDRKFLLGMNAVKFVVDGLHPVFWADRTWKVDMDPTRKPLELQLGVNVVPEYPKVKLFG